MPKPRKNTPESSAHAYRDALIGLALVVATMTVFWEVGANSFVDFDDNIYVVENDRVKAGLTPGNIVWAFTTGTACNWHPLTWLSHMLDCSLYGLQSQGHHLTSLLLHTANVLLLFVVFRRMTRAPWASAFVAGFFALHPLRVESVAWIAERKDVLSGLFWTLTMLAYVRYVERPGAGRYAAVLVLFSLGLMAKPVMVTLPCVLLLLDLWPLSRGRFEVPPTRDTLREWRGLALEKVPLLALAAISSLITIVVQRQAMGTFEAFPLGSRLANAAVSYVRYIGKAAWPTKLAAFYPYESGSLPMWQVGGAVLLLIVISVVAIVWIRTRPHLAVGWFWYLGTLVPMIGVLQVGHQAMADRYTYLPVIGLSIMLAWGLPEALRRVPYKEWVLGAAAAIALLVLAVCTLFQVPRWRDTETLFYSTLASTRDNATIHYYLANSFMRVNRLEEAIAHYEEALRIKPDRPDINDRMGIAMWRAGRRDEAVAHFEHALRENPAYSNAHVNLGTALFELRRYDEARRHFEAILEHIPNHGPSRAFLERIDAKTRLPR